MIDRVVGTSQCLQTKRTCQRPVYRPPRYVDFHVAAGIPAASVQRVKIAQDTVLVNFYVHRYFK